MGHDRVELPRDCDACRLEAGAIEVFDPDAEVCRRGVPLEVRCPLCRARWVGRESPQGATLVQVDAPRDLTEREVLEAALAEWAAAEGYETVAALLNATFVTPRTEALHDALCRGEPLPTLADPFGLVGGSAGSPRIVDRPRPVAPIREPAPPRSSGWPLVSVMMADGVVHPAERAIVDAFYAAEGEAPLTDPECVVRAPQHVAQLIEAPRRPALVQWMCRLVWADGHADPSELRVLRAYARAWSIDDLLVQDWLGEYEPASTLRVRHWWRAGRLLFGRPPR